MKDNKKIYVYVAAGIIIGATGIVILRDVRTFETHMTRVFSPGDNNLIQIYLAPLGDPGNVVQCVETGSTFASQGELARVLDISPSAVSKHLRGSISDLFGKHYTVIGKAGQPLAQ